MITRSLWWIRGMVLALSMASMFWLSLGVQDVFASPDERANAFFSQTFAQNFSFCVSEPLNTIAQGLVHPRSTVAPGTCILPASFLGFPVMNGLVLLVFRALGSTIAAAASVLMTPCLALLGVLSWWWIVRRLSKNERLADLAALFVVIHPAWWYYGARVMMHNVPFVALLVIASAVFVWSTDRASRIGGLIAGILLGLALSMRLVEAPIIAFVIIGALILFRRSIAWKTLHCTPLFFAGLGTVMILLGYFALNHAVYGSWLSTGYNLPDTRSLESISDSSSAPVSFHLPLASLLFPFGIHPRAMARNVLQYGVQLYPVLSLLALVGMILAWRDGKRPWKIVIGFLACASVWMAAVYGSWSMADNINPAAVTVGNSHVRYWLPLFVVSSVFVAYALDRWMRQSRVREIIGIGLLFGVAMMSARTVFGGTDGLFATRTALVSYEATRDQVEGAVHCDADPRPVIIVDHADKYLFPDCRVVVPLRDESTYAMIPTLLDAVPLYYFGLTLPQKDIAYLNSEKLPPLGVQIEYLKTIGDQSLYRFVRTPGVSHESGI